MSRVPDSVNFQLPAELSRQQDELASSICFQRAPFVTLTAICLLTSGCVSFPRQTADQCTKCDALCARAREAREKGNSDQANHYINEALRERPTDMETRRQLAETLWKNGRTAEAVSLLTSLCDQQPNDVNLATRLAVMQWDAGMHKEAANTAEFVLNREPQCKDAWRIRARNEVENGKHDAAFISYNRLSQLAPDDILTLIELGDLNLKRGHPDRASPLFRTAIQHPQITSKQRTDVEWQLGIAYARSERWTLAVATLEPAIARRNATAEDWCLLAKSRLQCGDIAGAQHDLRQAFGCDSQSVAARDLAQQIERSYVSLYGPIRVTQASYEQISTR